jgi:hypothetical protein
MTAGKEPHRLAVTSGRFRLLHPRPMTTMDNPHTTAPSTGLTTLRQMVEAASAALEQAADIGSDVGVRQEQLRVAEQRLDVVGQLLERARRELGAIASEVLRASLAEGGCGVAWPACSHCLGVGLASSAGSSWCPSCGRLGPPGSARPAYLCTERPTVTVRDATGVEEAMCLSHAAGAVRRIDRLTVVGATEEEVRRLVAACDRPLRVDLVPQVTRPARNGFRGRT